MSIKDIIKKIFGIRSNIYIPGALPGGTVRETSDGWSYELPHEAFMEEMRRRARMYKAAGIELLPDVERDLEEHPIEKGKPWTN